MTQPYSYNISTDTANAKVNPVDLTKEIRDVTWLETFIGLNIKGGMQSDGTFIYDSSGKFEVHFTADLPEDEKTNLDGILSSHQGVAITSKRFITMISVLGSDLVITNDAGFDEVGGVVIDLGLFTVDPSEIIMFATGLYKTSGVTGQNIPKMRIIEESDPEDTILSTHEAPDTSGVWSTFEFQTITSPTLGLRVFKIECTRDSATQFETKCITLSLFRVN